MANPLKWGTRRVYAAIRTYRAFRSNPLADLSHLKNAMAPVHNPIDEDQHQQIVERLIQAYGKAKALQADVPLPYLPAGEWDQDIKTRRAEYLQALSSNDVNLLGELLKNFFRNSGVAGVWVFAYFSDIYKSSTQKKRRFVNDILADYSSWSDFVDGANISDVSAPPIGNPWGYLIDGSLLLPNSLRHHYYGAHVKSLVTGVESPVVAEIGGGYGGFAYSLMSSSRGARYIDFDLPEILLVASYYLMNAFPNKNFLLFGEAGNDNPLTSELINEYDVILLPNFCLPQLASNSVDLFINTNSLSEMDYHTVAEYISQIVRTCKRYFFHVNSDRETPKKFGHIEVPSSRFPVPTELFTRVYKSDSLWGGGSGRYREHLYQRVSV